MLVEIPDPEVILSVIIAFLIGLGGLYAFYKLRPFIKTRDEGVDSSQSELMEYYERQLIDMKIRLDALEIQGIEQKSGESNVELKEFLEKLAKNEGVQKVVESTNKVRIVPEKPVSTPRMPNLDHTNAIDYVLHLITDKAMTSRDIQITLKRSREHTSRLMKKLFEDGYVKRNTNSKPYSYSITEKGKDRIDKIQSDPIIA